MPPALDFVPKGVEGLEAGSAQIGTVRGGELLDLLEPAPELLGG
jgi:hypothetical protein